MWPAPRAADRTATAGAEKRKSDDVRRPNGAAEGGRRTEKWRTGGGQRWGCPPFSLQDNRIKETGPRSCVGAFRFYGRLIRRDLWLCRTTDKDRFVFGQPHRVRHAPFRNAAGGRALAGAGHGKEILSFPVIAAANPGRLHHGLLQGISAAPCRNRPILLY